MALCLPREVEGDVPYKQGSDRRQDQQHPPPAGKQAGIITSAVGEVVGTLDQTEEDMRGYPRGRADQDGYENQKRFLAEADLVDRLAKTDTQALGANRESPNGSGQIRSLESQKNGRCTLTTAFWIRKQSGTDRAARISSVKAKPDQNQAGSW